MGYLWLCWDTHCMRAWYTLHEGMMHTAWGHQGLKERLFDKDRFYRDTGRPVVHAVLAIVLVYSQNICSLGLSVPVQAVRRWTYLSRTAWASLHQWTNYVYQQRVYHKLHCRIMVNIINSNLNSSWEDSDSDSPVGWQLEYTVHTWSFRGSAAV